MAANPRQLEIERRSFGLIEVKLDDATDEGTFSGYGAIFGNTDSYGDVIKHGAFSKTLKEWKSRGKLPPMLLQHGGFFNADDMLPVGVWTSMEENSRGLKVEGKLFALNTERGQYIHEGLKSGVLDGLSIGFMVREAQYGTKPDDPARTLTDIELWELSIVTFPANDKARVGAAKSLPFSSLDEIRAYEAILRDEGGTRSECVRAVRAWKILHQRDAGAPGITPRDADVTEATLLRAVLESPL